MPLSAVAYGHLCDLAEVLLTAGARAGHSLDELLVTADCDALISRMLTGVEDYADVPAIDEQNADAETARSLLRWAAQGTVPARYRRFAAPGPLLAAPDVARLAEAARKLTTAAAPDLAGFGAVLLAEVVAA